MIALRGQQKAYLLEQESERRSELKPKMDLRLVLWGGQQECRDQVPAPHMGGSPPPPTPVIGGGICCSEQMETRGLSH